VAPTIIPKTLEVPNPRMEDTSLDEFAEMTDESESTENPGNDSETDSEVVSLDDVEPATVTSRWGNNDEDCRECSESATRLWNDDGQFVCQSCKDW
jgi:hypothetical protein